MDAMTPEAALAKPKSRTRRWTVAMLAVAVTACAGAAIWYWPVAAPEQRANRFRDAAAIIPVVAAPAAKRDMPVWLDGLGTVQAFQSVTVKSMIDGPLLSIDFKEGQEVKSGDILARIDPRIYQAALDSAAAKKSLDEANLANARLDLARYQKLVLTNYASQQQADTARAQVAALEAQVRVDQAQIDNTRTQLSYTTVVAPLSGRVGMRMVDPGNLVKASDPAGLAMITQLQPISVLFSLPQQHLPAVAAAMKAGPPAAVAFPQGAGTGTALDTGVLAVLDNQIDPQTGTIRMKATFPNASGALWPGGFVGVRLQVDTVRDATVVAQSAVQRGPRGSFVYIVNEDNTVRRQPVTVGYEDPLGVIILTGLNPGERVVTDGASRLSDGVKVAVVSPDADTRPPRARPAAPGRRRP